MKRRLATAASSKWQFTKRGQFLKQSYRFQHVYVCFQVKQACPPFSLALVVMPNEVLLCMASDLGWSPGGHIVFGDSSPVPLRFAVKLKGRHRRQKALLHDACSYRCEPFPASLSQPGMPCAPPPSKGYLPSSSNFEEYGRNIVRRAEGAVTS